VTHQTYPNASSNPALSGATIVPLEVLAIAPHPDDAEIGCGGTLLRAAGGGKRTGILELTRGELGTLGTPEIRDLEALEAAQALGLAYRGNLRWADGSVTDTPMYRLELAQAIRDLKPRVVLVPHETDRHPDHAGAARVCAAATHFAGLRNAPLTGAPHRVGQVLHYQGNAPIVANVLVDVSDVMEAWERAIVAHRSQFTGERISETVTPEILERRKARLMYWGTFIGVRYAEAFESLLPTQWQP
jgi:N-acetylglucosamine malate deacetylase 1